MSTYEELWRHVLNLKARLYAVEELIRDLLPYTNFTRRTTIGEIARTLEDSASNSGTALMNRVEKLLNTETSIASSSLYLVNFKENDSYLSDEETDSHLVLIHKLKRLWNGVYCEIVGEHSKQELPAITLARAEQVHKYLISQVGETVDIRIRNHSCDRNCMDSLSQNVSVYIRMETGLLWVDLFIHKAEQLKRAYDDYLQILMSRHREEQMK